MMIRTLTLRNFRSHRDTVLELDRFNFLRGPNGCGKSSVRMAIEYLFTGRCELTDSAGRGSGGLIRAGAKEFEISAVLGSGGTIRRRRTLKSQSLEINGKKMPVEAGQESLARQIGHFEALPVLLNAGQPGEVSAAAQWKQMAASVDLGTFEIPREVLSALCAIREEPPRLRTALDAKSAEERFRDLYLEANRALETLGELGKEGIPASPRDDGHGIGQPEGARRQKGWLVFERADVEACLRNAGSTPRSEAAEFDDSAAEFQSLCEDEELPDHDLDLGQDEAQSHGRGQFACGEASTAKPVATQQDRIKKRSPGGQAVPRSAMAIPLNSYPGADCNAGPVQNGFKGTQDHRSLEIGESTFDKSCPTNKSHRAESPGKMPAGMGFRAEAKDSGCRPIMISSGRPREAGTVTESTGRAGRNGAREEWRLEKRRKLENRIAALRAILDFFGPDGAVLREARVRLKSFEGALNRKLSIFGYAATLTLQPPGISMAREGPHDPALPLRLLSASERFRFWIAFQIALAEITGIRLVVIDGAEILDTGCRRALTSMLLGSGIEQAIVLATAEGAAPGGIPTGVKFFSLAGADT